MTTNFDAVTLTILAAIGLELGCALGPGGIGGSGTDAGKVDGSETEGVGAGDTGDSGDTSEPPDIPELPELPDLSDIPNCDNPTLIMQLDSDLHSGFVRCDNGFVHRLEAVECAFVQASSAIRTRPASPPGAPPAMTAVTACVA